MKYFALLLTLLVGCGSIPQYRDHKVLMPKITNKYVITLKGQVSNFAGNQCPTNELFKNGTLQKDLYVDGDVAVITSLASLKGYVVLNADSAQDLYSLVDDIAGYSNSHTETIITLSGECSEKGFAAKMVRIQNSMSLISPGELIVPDELLNKIRNISGRKLLIISGCQSGTFVLKASDYEKNNMIPNTVVIGACPVGYATTECQRYGTTALMAGIIKLYPTESSIIDLGLIQEEDIKAGDFIENIRHKMSDLFDGGLPISYKVVKFSNTTFKF